MTILTDHHIADMDFILLTVIVVDGTALIDHKDLFFSLMFVNADAAVLLQNHLGIETSLLIEVFLAADIFDDDLTGTFPHGNSDFCASFTVFDDHMMPPNPYN